MRRNQILETYYWQFWSVFREVQLHTVKDELHEFDTD